MQAKLHRGKVEEPKPVLAVTKPTTRNVARTCRRCKMPRSSIDYAYATSRICNICLNKVTDTSVWVVGSAGSPGLGKRR